MSKNAKKVSDSELARFFLEKVEKDAIIPVSYTHLDVYKRQVKRR